MRVRAWAVCDRPRSNTHPLLREDGENQLLRDSDPYLKILDKNNCSLYTSTMKQEAVLHTHPILLSTPVFLTRLIVSPSGAFPHGTRAVASSRFYRARLYTAGLR